MIVLHAPPLIFLKPHKVGGTSFEIALSRFAGPRDIVTPLSARGRDDETERRRLGFGSPRNYRWPAWRVPFLPAGEWRAARRQRQWPGRFRSHTSAAQAKARLPAATWEGSLKLSIARNPYDCAVSTYYWARREGEDFGTFLARFAPILHRNEAKYTIGGRDVIDIYLRYEGIGADIAALEARLPALAGLGETFAALKAKAGYRPPGASVQALFARHPGAAGLVADRCRFEIERFGYRLDHCD